MRHGIFESPKGGDQKKSLVAFFRCSGQIITRNAGNYKFYLSSDDGAWTGSSL